MFTKRKYFEWNDKCNNAFGELNRCVTTTPILQVPNWSLLFHISTNASDTTIRVVLSQQEENKPCVIYYISKKLNPTGVNYMVTTKGVSRCYSCYQQI